MAPKQKESSSSSSSSSYHDLLKELKSKSKDDGSVVVVSPLEVLNRLLEHNQVSTEAVLKVHAELVSEKKEEQVDPLTSTNGSSNLTKPDPSSRRTRHIALRFYYDGGKYSGLAQNVGQDNDNSVEKALFQALMKARLIESRDSCGYSRCGRTDKGVSSAGQVVALQLKSAIPMNASYDPEGFNTIDNNDLPRNEIDIIKIWVPPKAKKNNKRKGPTSADQIIASNNTERQEKEMTEYHYAKILNNLLPEDIRILGWSPVSDEFSARFSATTRVYRYFFVKRQMNLDRMQQGLDQLVGTHDFRNFCKMDVEKVYNFERVIHSASIVEADKNGVAYVQIVGQAFLWHQIRCIMEVMFMIGRGLESPGVVKELLNIEKHPGKPSYPLASEFPLVLHDCEYSNLPVGYSVPNLWNVTCQLETQWEVLTLAAARIRNAMESLRSKPVLRADLEMFTQHKLSERAKKRLKTSHDDEATEEIIGNSTPENLTWNQAMEYLKDRGFYPDPQGLDTRVHIPLLERSMGTTYEEKLEALQKSDRRRIKYEENVVQKRKTKEEDAAFYKHKISQGGVR